MSEKKAAFEIRGPWVVAALLVLTGIVGTLFLILGPRATERNPGVLHVGLRFDNEGTADFLAYNGGRPIGSIRFFASPDPATPAKLEFTQLQRGRNLVPLEALGNGIYHARIEVDGFVPETLEVQVEERLLLPVPQARYPEDTIVDNNLIGVRLTPIRSD